MTRATNVKVWLVLAVMLIITVSACGGSEEQSKPRPLPEGEKALRPGVYRSEEFKPSLSFRVGEGWTSASPEVSDILGLIWGESAGLSFVNAQQVLVYKPTRTGTPNLVEAPEDMVGWFQHHPYLQTSKPEPVKVGGAKGMQFDVVVGDLPEGYSSVCGSDCVDLFRSDSGLKLGLGEEDEEREIILKDGMGETVIIRLGSPATDFDRFASEAQKVIDSVEWRAS